MNQPASPDTDGAVAAPSNPEPADRAQDNDAPDEGPATARGGGIALWLAALGVLLSLVAVAGAAYLWRAQQSQAVAIGGLSELAERTDKLGSELGAVQERLEMLTSGADRLAGDIDALRDTLASQRRQLDELPARIGRVEATLEKLPGVSGAARSSWLVAEAEYYLRIGNAQLTLARNPDVALRALQLADEKLRDAGDPGLTRVRAVLADEMTALRAMPRPDAEGIALQLSSLGRAMSSLPLARQNPETFGQPQNSDNGLSGAQRAWQAIRDAFLGLVRIKRTDEAALPLRTEAEESLLRRSLDTELALARLALIRGEGPVYRDALDSVTLGIQRYFDTAAPAVKATLEQLGKLRGAELPESLPDISGSLRLLLNLDRGQAAAR